MLIEFCCFSRIPNFNQIQSFRMEFIEHNTKKTDENTKNAHKENEKRDGKC